MHDTVLTVSALLGKPGTARPLALELPVPAEFAFPLVQLRAPVLLDGQLESVVEGILVRGRTRAVAQAQCARCLAPVEAVLEAPVTELFWDPARVTADDDDVEAGYLVVQETIDVDTLLRDVLATALPARPLCRPDCAGLCATCGQDRNQGDCACVDTDPDPRWAPLEGLRLPDS